MDLAADVRGRAVGQRLVVVPGVVGDRVPVRRDVVHDVAQRVDLSPDHAERGVDVVLGQQPQVLGRPLGVRAVVDRQHDRLARAVQVRHAVLEADEALDGVVPAPLPGRGRGPGHRRRLRRRADRRVQRAQPGADEQAAADQAQQAAPAQLARRRRGLLRSWCPPRCGDRAAPDGWTAGGARRRSGHDSGDHRDNRRGPGRCRGPQDRQADWWSCVAPGPGCSSARPGSLLTGCAQAKSSEPTWEPSPGFGTNGEGPGVQLTPIIPVPSLSPSSPGAGQQPGNTAPGQSPSPGTDRHR